MRKILNRRCSASRRILSSLIVLCMVVVLCPFQNRASAVPPYDFTSNEVTSSITVDGYSSESAWQINNSLTVLAGDNRISFGTLWDTSNLYLYFKVTDAAVINSNATYPWNDDSIEIYIDGDLTKGAYNSHGVQFIFRYGDENTYIYSNSGCQATGIEHKSIKTADGYAMEVAIPWANIGGLSVNMNKVIGTTFHCNDKDENIQSAEVSNVSYLAPSPGPDYENSSGWSEMTLGEPAAPALQSIAITKPANKLVYKVGDTLDITGMEVTGTYSDGSKKLEAISPADVYNFDSTKASSNEKLSVVVNGKTTYYSVCVNPTSTAADQKVNFRLSGNVADKTIETDGWKLNTAITDPNVALAAVFDSNTNAVYAKTTSDPIDASRVIAFDFQVNYDGVYTPVFTGGGSPTGGIGNIYIDDAYIGTYDFYNAAAYVPQIPSANLKTIALQHGVHTLVFEAVGRNAARTDTETKWRMYIGELNLVGKASFPTLSSVAISADSTTIEANKTTNLKYSATMSDGFIDNLLPPFRSGIDTSYSKAYSYSTKDIVSVDDLNVIKGLKAGASTITAAVTMGGVTKSGDLAMTVSQPAAPTLSSIAITKPASKLSYKVNDTLNITGLEVTGTYSDGSKKIETITTANVTGFDSSAAAASQMLTVTVNSKTATYTISVVNNDQAAPSGLTAVAPTSSANADGKINGTTTAMEYKLSTAATYTPVTGTSITGLIPGTYNVRLAAKSGYNASPATNVTVPSYSAATLSSIAITTQPTKKTYKIGETLDLTGMVVTGTYSDGGKKTETVTNQNVTGFSSSTAAASQTLTVTVSGKTATFTVAIVNNDQAAPTGLTGVAPTSLSNNDGKITGTTTDMEYKLSTASTYTAVTGTQISGLAAGTYNIRYKAKTGYNAGAAATVIVSNYTEASLSSIAITTQPTKKTYKVGESLSLTGMVVTGTYSDGSHRAITVSNSNVTGFNSSAISASQTLTVTVSGKTSTFTVSVIAGDQISPKGLSGIAPTSESNNDGKITGVTTAMEYKKSGAASYTAVTSTEITGLEPGTYYVRYKAKTNYNAGADAAVTVSAYTPITLNSIAITGQPTKLIYHVGDVLDLTGLTVIGTYSDGNKKTETVTSDNITGFDSSVRAVDQILTVNIGGKSATYKITIYDAGLYKATIQSSTGGEVLKGTTGNYQEGDVIELVASPVSGYKFMGWSVSGGGIFKNRNYYSTTFTMPAADVSITASFSRSILGGIGGGGSSSGSYGHSTSSITTTTTTPSTETPTTSNDKFSDLSGFDWAKEAINSLAQDGIINGMSDSSYAPGAKITRADFVTLLVRALDLTAEFSDNFSDVKSNDYYYNTLGVAKKLGIITGVGSNNYNPKASIARQDMMVITARALKAAGYELSDAAATELSVFSDSSAVADYAGNDVATLIKNGIIAGSGNAINPKGGSTRAEVAVMLYRILNMK